MKKIERLRSPHPIKELPAFAQVIFVVCLGAFVVLCALYYSAFGSHQSSSQEHWGQFGDYIGGLMNPIVALGALVGIWYSIALQKTELRETRQVLQETQKATEQQQKIDLLFRIIDQIRIIEREFKAGSSAVDGVRTGSVAIRYLSDRFSKFTPGPASESWTSVIDRYEAASSLHSLGNAWQMLVKHIDKQWPMPHEGDTYFELSLSLLTQGSYDVVVVWAMNTQNAGPIYLGQRYLDYQKRLEEKKNAY